MLRCPSSTEKKSLPASIQHVSTDPATTLHFYIAWLPCMYLECGYAGIYVDNEVGYDENLNINNVGQMR